MMGCLQNHIQNYLEIYLIVNGKIYLQVVHLIILLIEKEIYQELQKHNDK